MPNASAPDKNHTGVCGSFCRACGSFVEFIAEESQDKYHERAAQYGQPEEGMPCHGCRSDKLSHYCKVCTFRKCAAEKNIDFCGECEAFPCDALSKMRSDIVHHFEFIDSLKRINEVGFAKWHAEMMAHYACKQCGTINMAYDVACRSCGAVPSCQFVATHKDDILKQKKEWGVEP